MLGLHAERFNGSVVGVDYLISLSPLFTLVPRASSTTAEYRYSKVALFLDARYATFILIDKKVTADFTNKFNRGSISLMSSDTIPTNAATPPWTATPDIVCGSEFFIQ
eukprot:TRINITY_DN17242_c0_g1_i1.p1 TRINITY_DN17242_c0_g1~~TRINITY_DN17242_c0_g1_i1.p1  ORF type:complete len:108 (-),score=6.31 TRINITY_DN17242_c0_g1_i1:21-344(-)